MACSLAIAAFEVYGVGDLALIRAMMLSTLCTGVIFLFAIFGKVGRGVGLTFGASAWFGE